MIIIVEWLYILQPLYEYHNKLHSWGQLYQDTSNHQSLTEYLVYGPANSQALRRWGTGRSDFLKTFLESFLLLNVSNIFITSEPGPICAP